MLSGRGHVNLSTKLGPLDPLCEVGDSLGYDERLQHSELIEDQGLAVRVVDLPTLIALKVKAGRPKDRMVVPILVATLEERSALEAHDET